MRQSLRAGEDRLASQLARRGNGEMVLLSRSVVASSAMAPNTSARDVVASRMHHDARTLEPATAVGSLAEKGRICMPS